MEGSHKLSCFCRLEGPMSIQNAMIMSVYILLWCLAPLVMCAVDVAVYSVAYNFATDVEINGTFYSEIVSIDRIPSLAL